MVLSSIKQVYNQMPAGIKRFAKKALLLFVLWMVLYSFVMQPLRVPDKWITTTTANVTVTALNKLYKPGFSVVEAKHFVNNHFTFGSQILYGTEHTLFVADSCNAFDLCVLYISFFVCLPTTKKRMFLFSVFGIAALFLLNVARCFGLAWLSLNRPSWVDFAHHYLFTLVVYTCLFTAWV
ncbi:MAG TPA: hypothetical protein VHB48_18760, partial [Chitinophagaceae bacterium]|nr:hypothetical protein [Chitinophagaceae bacterium]